MVAVLAFFCCARPCQRGGIPRRLTGRSGRAPHTGDPGVSRKIASMTLSVVVMSSPFPSV